MRLLRTIGGFLLVLVGVIGLILPILPGWIFLIPGLVILSERFPSLRRALEWARAKAKTSVLK